MCFPHVVHIYAMVAFSQDSTSFPYNDFNIIFLLPLLANSEVWLQFSEFQCILKVFSKCTFLNTASVMIWAQKGRDTAEARNIMGSAVWR